MKKKIQPKLVMFLTHICRHSRVSIYPFCICHQARKGVSGGLAGFAPCFCLEMRLGERTRLTKFGELTQDRQHPELTPET